MPSSAPGSPGRTSAIRIMIVDDHEISRAAFRALLRAEGIDVIADFKANAHALTAARALNPDRAEPQRQAAWKNIRAAVRCRPAGR